MATLRGFVNDLAQVVEQTKMQHSLKIASGSVPNMEQYHRSVGRIEGMDQVVKTAREMLGQMEAAVDNDRLPEMDPPGAGQ
jgi:hypothetical protein